MFIVRDVGIVFELDGEATCCVAQREFRNVAHVLPLKSFFKTCVKDCFALLIMIGDEAVD